jgi:hypothetical protein
MRRPTVAEPVYVRARVIGAMPIRDAVTRESVTEGGIVRLLPRVPGTGRLPTCARHPRRGVVLQRSTCTCGGTLIDALVECGAVEVLGDGVDEEPT